jgi:hypothetical protein
MVRSTIKQYWSWRFWCGQKSHFWRELNQLEASQSWQRLARSVWKRSRPLVDDQLLWIGGVSVRRAVEWGREACRSHPGKRGNEIKNNTPDLKVGCIFRRGSWQVDDGERSWSRLSDTSQFRGNFCFQQTSSEFSLGYGYCFLAILSKIAPRRKWLVQGVEKTTPGKIAIFLHRAAISPVKAPREYWAYTL